MDYDFFEEMLNVQGHQYKATQQRNQDPEENSYEKPKIKAQEWQRKKVINADPEERCDQSERDFSPKNFSIINIYFYLNGLGFRPILVQSNAEDLFQD